MELRAIIYVHGKNGSASEADHYKHLFPDARIVGLDYRTFTPWETGAEIHECAKALRAEFDSVTLIANSIGAFFSLNADLGGLVDKAYFISPVVDMERMIRDMMFYEKVSENDLKEKGVIPTSFGEDLSWEYLRYVTDHPVVWTIPTDILYGEKDVLVPFDTITAFSEKYGVTVTSMPDGEHWFHTSNQLNFLDDWLKKCENIIKEGN